MDPDESHLRKAAHCMVRNLTSGLAMITCREQVVQLLTSNLKQHFLSVLMVFLTIIIKIIISFCNVLSYFI